MDPAAPTDRDRDFDALYRGCADRLTGQLYLLTGDREEARDCVQEALERAWTRWDSVSRLDDPQAWVRTVARRLAVSRWRRTRNAVTAWRRLDEETARRARPAQHEDRIGLAAALQRLPLDYRTVLVLHHLCDLDLTRIADETGSSVPAVKSRLLRARRALAALLPDWDELRQIEHLEPGEQPDRAGRHEGATR